MLIFNPRDIGNKLLAIRKCYGMTQMEVAEAAGLSCRAYADIERGSVNMRVETVLRICQALHITPNEILTQDRAKIAEREQEIVERIESCSPKDRETLLQLAHVFLESISD